MRVECEACHAVTDATVAIDAGVVVVTCAACAAVARVVPAKVAASPPAAVDLCPKCGEPRRPTDLACASCGLLVERMAAFAEAREAAVAEPVRAAWDRAVLAWDEPAHHDALLQAVTMHGAYAWAAGRYRDATRTRPGDAIGPRQLDRIRRAAEVTLLASAGARPDTTAKPYRATMAILAVMVVAIVVGLGYAMLSRDHSSTTEQYTPAQPAGTVAPRPGTR